MTNYKSRIERRKSQNQANQNGKNPPQKKKGLFKKILLSLILIMLILGLTGVVSVFAIIKNAPDLDPKMLRDPLTTKIVDMNNKQATNIFTSEKRIYTPISDIPKVVQNAFVSTEDVRFYKHFGIDIQGIGRAVIANFTEGFGSEGASTITQQVVRNSYLTKTKTFTRKIQEAYMAIKLEQKYSKDQILEMYLNKIFLGENAYGVATAAQVYFGKSIKDVNLSEAAVLAALPKAPSYYDPVRNPDAAKKRRNLVLDLMVKNHVVSKDEAAKAKAIPIKDLLKKGKVDNTRKYDAFVQEVHHELVDVKKVVSDDEFYKGGLTIYTTLDPNAQKYTEEALKKGTFTIRGTTYNLDKNIDAATSLIDTKTGAVRAIGAGRHYKNFGDFNHATVSDNGVGSTAKPIMDYGPAIEYMNWSTAHQLADEPHNYSNKKSVTNWDKTYYGQMTMRAALALSRNVPAVKTYQELLANEGPDKISAFVGKLGLTNQKYFSPEKIKGSDSYAIGTFPSSPLQMAAAYAAFGNKGIYNEPYTVRKVVFPDGNEIKVDHDEHPAMKESTAYMITDVLKDIFSMVWTTPSGAQHTGTGIKIGSEVRGIPVAAKTGTNGSADEWIVGYTPEYSLGIWTGYDDNKPLTRLEESYSKALFAEMMTHLSSKDVSDFPMPDSVVEKTVEKDTGLLPSSNTPSNKLIKELFVKGYEPKQVSDRYKKLDPPTNLKTDYDPANRQLILNWDYSGSKNVAFDIGQKVKDKSQKLGSTSDHKIMINNVEPGASYEFSVTAVNADKNKFDRSSDPAIIKVDIPNDKPQNNGPDNGNGSNKGNNNGDTNSDPSNPDQPNGDTSTDGPGGSKPKPPKHDKKDNTTDVPVNSTDQSSTNN